MQTFVLADLAGYTALTEAHGDERAADVAAEFCHEVRGAMEAYGAQEVKTIGDALLLRVPDAAQALHLAARITGDHGARHHSLGVRVGMHTGPAVERDGDWFGATVNLAARIADQAGAGEVLLSAATRSAVGDRVLAGQLQPRGRRRLKNVSEPVELFALVPEGSAARRLPLDPVCRMAVDPALAPEHAVHRGVEHHFCSAACAEAFRRSPERYAGAAPGRRDLVLVSDEARERAARRVARAYQRGRLDADELEARTELVWRARTRADLRGITHDLPGRRRRGPSPWWGPLWPLAALVRLGRLRLRRRARRRALASGERRDGPGGGA